MNHQVFKIAQSIEPRPASAVRVLAIDPSLSCTGFALADVWDDGRMPGIRLHRFGFIEPPGTEKRLWERASACAHACWQEWRAASDVQAVAVEMPMIVTGGIKEDRSIAWLPGYGVVCGAVAARLEEAIASEPGLSVTAKRVFYAPSATEWASGIRTGGKGKPERVRLANLYTGLDLAKLAASKKAEAMADAALLARWTAIAFIARRKAE